MDFKALQKEAVSGWFSNGDARIKLRMPGDDDLTAARKESVKTWHEFQPNPARKNMLERVPCEEIDNETFMLALASNLIDEWEEVKWDGEVLECTDENKRMLMRESPAFRKWYTEAMDELTKKVVEEYGSNDPSKNSESMQSKS